MVRAGVPESVAMRISGHVSAVIFKGCAIVSEQDLKEARTVWARSGRKGRTPRSVTM
jgi:hypothetical protein